MKANSQPLRVMFVAGSLTAGGAERQLAYQARALVEGGVHVSVLSLDRGHYAEELRALPVDVVCIDTGARASRLASIVSRARQFSPDIVQATQTFANLYACAAAKACGAISIGALRGALATSDEHNGWLSRCQLRAPDAIIANSHNAAGEVRRFLRRRQLLHVLENAIDLPAIDDAMAARDALRRAAGVGATDVLVLGVGTLRRNKNFDKFIRVIDAAAAQAPNIKGVIIGGGLEEGDVAAQLDGAAQRGGNVRLLGRRANAVTLARGADIFLLTSRHEGFPNTLLEAMAAGLPSVTTPAGDAERVVTAARAGIARPFDDEAGLAAAVVELARSAARRAEMGDCARKYVEAEFALSLLWPRMRAIYAQIAAASRRPNLLNRLFLGDARTGR